MSLPASFLAQAENHGCFSGCFGHEARFAACLDAVQPVDEMFAVYCKDCLNFRVGILRSLLPAGSSAPWLADSLTAHNRRRRGYAWSLSGYHAVGPGFWLTAAYYNSCGVFLLNGARSRSVGSDLDLLLLAFQFGVATATHVRMHDESEYDVCERYIDFSSPLGAIHCVQDLFASPQCSIQPKRGFQRVTVAEFRPLAAFGVIPPMPPLPASSVKQPTALPPTAESISRKMGDICPKCQAEICERALFTGSYIGCLCD